MPFVRFFLILEIIDLLEKSSIILIHLPSPPQPVVEISF